MPLAGGFKPPLPGAAQPLNIRSTKWTLWFTMKPGDGASYRVAATALPEGKILEYIYVYKNRSVLTEIDCSIGSIHLKEKFGS